MLRQMTRTLVFQLSESRIGILHLQAPHPAKPALKIMKTNSSIHPWRSLLWTIILFLVNCLFAIQVEGKKCPGQCIQNVTDCNEKGGKVAGYCTNELACCDYSYAKLGTCGSKMSNLSNAMFQSPSYPEYISGDLVCQFDFVLNSNATGLIVEYSDIVMDGPGFVKGGHCESDMFIFKGFPDWTPPVHCGSMVNYSAVIDLNNQQTKGMTTFTILALMSSDKYRWDIKVTQLYKQPTKPTIRIVSTESSTQEGNNETEADNDEKSSSAIDSSDSRKIDNFEQTYEESEEEMHRILQLTSTQNRVQRISVSNLNEDTDYQNYPSEESFVVNGDDIEISKVPWQASLRKMVSPRFVKLLKLKNCSVSEGLHFCGGSIISEWHILSAAHCFFLGNKFNEWERISTIKVVLGDTDLCDEETEGIQEFKVEKVYYHYGYDDRALLNDMVVIKLNRKIKFTKTVQPIKMAEEDMNFEHQIGFVSGWGRTNITSTEPVRPELLQFADEMFIGNSTECIEHGLKTFPVFKAETLLRYPKYRDVFNSLMCTYTRDGSVATLVGHGDSGGPLVVFTTFETISEEIPMKMRKSGCNCKSKKVDKLEKPTKEKGALLVGVISYMIRSIKEEDVHDVSDYVDFYQSVPYYRRWIDLAMQ